MSCRVSNTQNRLEPGPSWNHLCLNVCGQFSWALSLVHGGHGCGAFKNLCYHPQPCWRMDDGGFHLTI
jgi:hypothetical protein